jgi:hypothetical protein
MISFLNADPNKNVNTTLLLQVSGYYQTGVDCAFTGVPRGVRLYINQIPIRMKDPYDQICRSG